jgi:hypothetical protein
MMAVDERPGAGSGLRGAATSAVAEARGKRRHVADPARRAFGTTAR